MTAPLETDDPQVQRRAAAKVFATQHVELLLLSLLVRRAASGNELQGELEVRTEGDFALPPGVIYPALYRLQAAGLVVSTTTSADGRSHRLYEITDAGRDAQAERMSTWTRHVQKMQSLMRS